MTDIAALQSEILAAVAGAADEAALEAVRVAALGKKGSVSELLKPLGAMRPDERKIQGPSCSTACATPSPKPSPRAKAQLARRGAGSTAGFREAGRHPAARATRTPAAVHPITQVLEEIIAIFADLGFAVAEGPDVEYDDYNFTKLNIPPDHPARQMQDTFYVAPQGDGSAHVLRTHTSPVQVRVMLKQKPPIRVISPGRTYRVDSDATHSPMFHQVEALVVDEGIHLGHLKWTVEEFCKAFFEIDTIELRARPSFFPFTEPSLEWDMRCDRSVPGKITFGERQ